MSPLPAVNRLACFDKKTQDVIRADMIKMKASPEEALRKIERNMSKMASEEDELFSRIYQQIQKTADSNDELYNTKESLARLTGVPDDVTCFENQKEQQEIRQRPVVTRQPALPRGSAPPRVIPADDGISASYIIYRIIFMIVLIFLVPFFQSYFG